jgi:single-strand DNA-binding protein
MYDKFGNLNKAFIMGRAGKDPEVRYSQSGLAILKVSIATTTRGKGREGDEPKEETQWHSVTAFGKTAEFAAERLKKGSQVFVEGQIRYRSWDKEDGTKGYATEIAASRIEVLGEKSQGYSG